MWSIEIDDLCLFWTIFGTFIFNLFMTPPKHKEKSENALYHPLNFEKGLVPPKILNVVAQFFFIKCLRNN